MLTSKPRLLHSQFTKQYYMASQAFMNQGFHELVNIKVVGELYTNTQVTKEYYMASQSFMNQGFHNLVNIKDAGELYTKEHCYSLTKLCWLCI